jgi:hypothetical protein
MVEMWDGWNGLVMEWFWYDYGYGMVLDRDDFGIALGSCVIYRTPVRITLYGN